MIRRRITRVFSLLGLALLLVGSDCAFAALSPVLQAAITDYNARNYRLALTKLQTLPKSGPGSDRTHYYLALCYQATNQMRLAQTEYATVYQYSRDNALRYNASLALKSLERWSSHRNYSGNGNNFSRQSTGGGGGGGGCGPSG